MGNETLCEIDLKTVETYLLGSCMDPERAVRWPDTLALDALPCVER